jgi:hypothetical protein
MLIKDLFGNRSGSYSRHGLPTGGSPTPAFVSNSILVPIGEVTVARSKDFPEMIVGAAVHVSIGDYQAYGGTCSKILEDT